MRESRCVFGIGIPELILIAIIALVVVGPKRMPDLARTIGKGVADIKRATDEVRESLVDHPVRKEMADIRKSVSGITDMQNSPDNSPKRTTTDKS